MRKSKNVNKKRLSTGTKAVAEKNLWYTMGDGNMACLPVRDTNQTKAYPSELRITARSIGEVKMHFDRVIRNFRLTPKSICNAYIRQYQHIPMPDGYFDYHEPVYGLSVSDANLINNTLIRVNYRSSPIRRNASPAELKAQDTLRDMLTERDWRRYACNGFIIVKGAKGYYYQVFKDQRPIRVYKDGKLIDTICIHTEGSLPPTDHVIHMKVLIELNEDMLWKNGNVRRTG